MHQYRTLALAAIDDIAISMRAQNRDWPAIALDSQNNVHIVWEDNYDELGRFYNQPQIYYSMVQNGGGCMSRAVFFSFFLVLSCSSFLYIYILLSFSLFPSFFIVYFFF